MTYKDAVVFPDIDSWRTWLAEHHADVHDVWILHPKKASKRPGIRYSEGVEEALAWGWIDGKMRRVDEDYFAQRYSPRRPASVWSLSNRRRAERLIAEGRMTPAGLALVDEARKSGAWERAWTDAEPASLPRDLAAALETASAREDFDGLPNSSRNAYIRWVEDSKRPTTRDRRVAAVVDRARKGLRWGE